MAYQRKLPPPDRAAAQSWVKKFIRDAYANQIGLVVGVSDTEEDGIRLLARFPGETEDRSIALEPTEDMEFIFPGEVKARYRPLTREDRERLAALKQDPTS